MADKAPRHLLHQLDEDDLNMVTSFILVSGLIKDLATQYGVSYPTMRQRLDRLIERVRRLVDGVETDPLSDYLADLLTRGQLSPYIARRIRELHRAAVSSTDPVQPDGDQCDD